MSIFKKLTFLFIISFILMLSPIIARMSQVGIEKFDYLAFQIPLTFFIFLYLGKIYSKKLPVPHPTSAQEITDL